MIAKDCQIYLPTDTNGNLDYTYMESYMQEVESRTQQALNVLQKQNIL